MEKWKSSLKAASGFFAIIPGLAVIATNIGVPPGCSKLLFCAVIESFGIFTLLLLRYNQDTFNSFSAKRINILSILSIMVFASALFLYLFLFNQYVDNSTSKPLFFPIWPQGELKAGFDKLGSRASLIQEWGRDDVNTIIRSSSSGISYTILFFLFLYQLFFVSLTFSFGLLASCTSNLNKTESK